MHRLSTQLARLIYLIVGWSCIGIVYNGTTYLQGTPTVLEPSCIDELIAFSPHGIWLYLSFFLIIPLSFFYAPYSHVRWMSICFIAAALLAGICYLIYPTTMVFPVDTGSSFSSWLLAHLMEVDIKANCCPSLHVTLTIIVVCGCLNTKRPIRSSLLVLWGVGICFSIVQLRRHVFVDFIGGIIMALLVGYSVRYLLNYFDRKRALNA